MAGHTAIDALVRSAPTSESLRQQVERLAEGIGAKPLSGPSLFRLAFSDPVSASKRLLEVRCFPQICTDLNLLAVEVGILSQI